MRMRGHDIEVYDNPRYIDRYTVVVDGADVYAMSRDPLSPVGVNLYCGNLADLNRSNFGQPVFWDALPERVRKAIELRLRDYEEVAS